jgi:hypothetical protein
MTHFAKHVLILLLGWFEIRQKISQILTRRQQHTGVLWRQQNAIFRLMIRQRQIIGPVAITIAALAVVTRT